MHGVTMTCTEKTTFQVTQLEQMTRDTPAHTHTQTHTDTHTHFLCSLYLARHAGEYVSTQANSHQALGNTIHTYSTVGATEEKPGSMNTGWGQTEYRRYV